jgi:hypothetical protein
MDFAKVDTLLVCTTYCPTKLFMKFENEAILLFKPFIEFVGFRFEYVAASFVLR